MVLKINFAIAFVTSFINGIVTFCKFYNYISHTELFLLIFLRVLITFIFFFAVGLGIYFFLKQQVPQIFTVLKPKKPVPRKIDYVLPAVSPTESVEESTPVLSEEKKTLPDELAKADHETLALVIRTVMSQE